MARVRPRRRSLADLIDLDDLGAAVDDLLGMNESEFTRAVLYYLEGDRLGMDAMRDPDVIERTYETIDRLLHAHRQALHNATDSEKRQRLARMIQSLDFERKAIRDEALAERAARIQETAGERQAEYAERTAARLERAAERQRAAREAIQAAQKKTQRQRAADALVKRHEREYLSILREIQRQDEQARIDGGGAADPPGGGSTAPGVPLQAARA